MSTRYINITSLLCRPYFAILYSIWLLVTIALFAVVSAKKLVLEERSRKIQDMGSIL